MQNRRNLKRLNCNKFDRVQKKLYNIGKKEENRPMELQRLNNEELIEKSKEIFYDYLASSEDFYTGTDYEPCTKKYHTVADMLY